MPENKLYQISKIKPRSIPYHLIIIFLILAAGIGVSGYLYYEKQKEIIKKDKQDDLSAITDLKVSQIVNWRKERMGDARVIFENHLIIPHIQQFMKKPTVPAYKKEILIWMKSQQENYRYKSIILLDTKGNIRLAVPDGKEILGPDAKRFAAEAVRAKKVIFSDLYRSKTTNVIRLTLVSPLFVSKGQDNILIGVLLLRIDPNEFLYSLIQSWPTPTQTAETILVRREGGNVIFLNELRHRKDTALTLRFPITEKQLPAAMAARGIEGVVEGIDYRGIPVLAAYRAIPDTPWFLVTKVDTKEVYEPIRKLARFVTFLILVLIAGAGASTGLIWRHQRALFYRTQYESELERQAERKQAEADLAKEKTFVDSAIDSLPGVFYLFDENGKFVRWNKNFEIVSGYSAEEIAKMSPLDFFAGEGRNLIAERIQEVLIKGSSTAEANFISKDGKKTPYLFTGRLFTSDNKNYIVGMGIDISELKEAEKSLKESEEILRGLLNANPESIFLIDTNGIVLAANETTAKRLGKSVNELIGHYVYDLIPTEVAEKRKPYIDEVIQTGRPTRFEDVRKGIYFDNYIQPIFDDKGNVTKIAILAVDITHRKHAEEEIRTLNAELEQRVRDRTAQFEAANKELEAFSYSVSHDLRAPLRAIDGFTHAIIEDYADKFDEEGKRLLDIVSSNAQKMGQLIDDLLTFSRTGRQELRMSKIEMDTLARTVFEELKAAASERTIQFTIKPLPLAHGDQAMIRQVFVNLLSNAIKFTRPKETAIIEVGGWRGDKDNLSFPTLEKGPVRPDLPGGGEGGFEEIPPEQNFYYVKDNGVGFNIQYANKLFGVFQRLHSETEFEGTGVGLAIVKRIIQRHGGRVWAEGKVNEGATFYFTLPRKGGNYDSI